MAYRSIGVIRHPARDVSGAAERLREAARRHGMSVEELSDGPAPPGIDLLVSLGGDGTLLAALRAARGEVPVLGVACGSVGALTSLAPADLSEALGAVVEGSARILERPALAATDQEGREGRAFNDVSVVRAAGTQASFAVSVDGELYARVAGDGVVVSTPSGSTGYNLAAGGPVLHPDLAALVVTPLTPHGGRVPPLAVPAACEVTFEWLHRAERSRVELDGRPSELSSDGLRVTCAHPGARLLLVGHPAAFAGLRGRRLILDSPRADVIVGRERGEGAPPA